MKTVKIVLVAMLSLGFLVACNTMSGLGKDIERTGEKIQDKARK